MRNVDGTGRPSIMPLPTLLGLLLLSCCRMLWLYGARGVKKDERKIENTEKCEEIRETVGEPRGHVS